MSYIVVVLSLNILKQVNFNTMILLQSHFQTGTLIPHQCRIISLTV